MYLSVRRYPGETEHMKATQPTPAPTEPGGVPPLEHVSTFVRFVHHDMVGTGLLLVSSLIALLVVNLGGAEWYHHFWETHFGFTLGDFAFDQTLHHWVNDGLMAMFFFVVGLEIKRELLAGELASWRKAVLPAAAAVGGMIVPAAIYAGINYGAGGSAGWGIPMATDIAFAAGCIAMLRKWVPSALIVFLVALAIVDDLGAVTVIAVFYTGGIEFEPLVIGGMLIGLSAFLGRVGVRMMLPYALIGIVLWLAFLQSGVHATIAGVLLAFTIPATARYQTHNFAGRVRQLVQNFTHAEELWPQETKDIKEVMVNSRQQSLLRHMESEIQHVEAPLQRIEHNLEPFAVFVIMPIFAFANAGVELELEHLGALIREPVTVGIIAGLAIGKPLGVLLAAWLAVKVGLATLPAGVRWSQLLGVGMLAGIGFTMSLFINELAFVGEGAEEFIAQGKIGIFLASFVSAIAGLLILKATCNEVQDDANEAGH